MRALVVLILKPIFDALVLECRKRARHRRARRVASDPCVHGLRVKCRAMAGRLHRIMAAAPFASSRIDSSKMGEHASRDRMRSLEVRSTSRKVRLGSTRRRKTVFGLYEKRSRMSKRITLNRQAMRARSSNSPHTRRFRVSMRSLNLSGARQSRWAVGAKSST
jgi:hypothetical protein